MSLAIALPAAFAAAIAYGGSSAVLHDAAHTGTGETDARGLLRLLREPRWWLGIAGDTLGFGLQIIALITGPVVLVQPLFILCLPLALPIRARMGGPRPGRQEYLACAVLVAGLGAFFALVGDPGGGRTPSATVSAWLSVVTLLIGAAVVLAVRRAGPITRAATFGSVAGAWFGVEAVLVNATSHAFHDGGVAAFGRAQGLAPLIGAIVVGSLGMILTQVAFQVGELGASFPGTLVADPLVAVLLGVVLLHESVPSGPLYLLGYVVAGVAMVAATLRLAVPSAPAAAVAAHP